MSLERWLFMTLAASVEAAAGQMGTLYCDPTGRASFTISFSGRERAEIIRERVIGSYAIPPVRAVLEETIPEKYRLTLTLSAGPERAEETSSTT